MAITRFQGSALPEIVQLIGQRLVTGQTLTDSDVSIAQGVTAVIAGTVNTVGKVAVTAVNAPALVIDAQKKQQPAQKLDQILQSSPQRKELTN